MQAVILWTLGTSWPHSRRASPVHICCASDEKAGSGRAESAVAAQAMAKRSAILLVWWKVIDAFPKVARGAGRYSLGALHAACAAARVIHHAGVTRCGCSISADVRIKSAAPPRRELCANAAKLQWLAPTLPGLLRARNFDRSADVRRLGFDATLLSARWIPKKEQMRVSAPFVLERDRTARRANAAFNGAVAALATAPSRPETSGAAATPRSMARLP